MATNEALGDEFLGDDPGAVHGRIEVLKLNGVGGMPEMVELEHNMRKEREQS